jgi:hypothetical protein
MRMNMRKIVVTVLAAVPIVLVPAMALAQEGSDLGPPGGPEIEGTGGSIGGVGGAAGSAFTGVEVAGLIALAIALLVLGVAVVALTRRRARSVAIGTR